MQSRAHATTVATSCHSFKVNLESKIQFLANVFPILACYRVVACRNAKKIVARPAMKKLYLKIRVCQEFYSKSINLENPQLLDTVVYNVHTVNFLQNICLGIKGQLYEKLLLRSRTI